ncbi:hypothetical protein [Actinomadura rubrisoli]|uniref:Uncharacterized protein n=1 Tax=Actinomadura rubrisoli TaxID=2530368 RepID=A0A4R5CDX6_9ACTN|nr:hypothetical protein [Actinomadura rubrisoli]TDD96443.1 hypothetical protein E1298_03105 [Actinomadura rubrisoli]
MAVSAGSSRPPGVGSLGVLLVPPPGTVAARVPPSQSVATRSDRTTRTVVAVRRTFTRTAPAVTWVMDGPP